MVVDIGCLFWREGHVCMCKVHQMKILHSSTLSVELLSIVTQRGCFEQKPFSLEDTFLPQIAKD